MHFPLIRVSVFAVVALASAALAFLLPPLVSEFVVGYLGYGLTLAGVAIWISTAIPRAIRLRSSVNWQRDRWHLLILMAIWLVVCQLEPSRFKIVLDEPALSGVSMMMHRDRMALLPHGADWQQGHFELVRGVMDKRPLLFPFLQSVVHDLTGFRVENAFYLNHAIGLGVIFLLFALGRRFAEARGGYAAVLLVVSAPLFANLVSSGGLDLLAGMLLLLVCWLALDFWDEPRDPARLGFLATSLLMLANTRYEGAFWILPFGMLILAGWWRERAVVLPWPVLVAPVFMIVPVLQHAVEHSYQVYWQVGAFEDRTAAFAFRYFPQNLEAAAAYFFGLSKVSTNSYVLSVLGSAGVAVLTVWLILGRWFKGAPGALRRNWAPLAAMMGGFWGLFFLLMMFNWGYFTHFIAQRLSLPIQLLAAPAAVWAWVWLPSAMKMATGSISLLAAFLLLEAMSDKEIVMQGFMLVIGTGIALVLLFFALRGRVKLDVTAVAITALLAFVLSGLPRAAAHRYTQGYASANAMWEVLTYLREHDGDALFVSSWPLIGVLAEQASARAVDVIASRDHLIDRLNSGELYKEALYAQILRYRSDLQGWELVHPPDLLRWFEGDLVCSKLVSARAEVQIYRVTAVRIHDGGSEGELEHDE